MAEPQKYLCLEDVLPAYRKVLVNTNHCLNLLDDLETGRTRSERITDWHAGERNSINFERMIAYLKELRTELEQGIESYTKYIFKLDQALRIQRTYLLKLKSKVSGEVLEQFQIHSSDTIADELEQLSKTFQKIARTGIFATKIKTGYGPPLKSTLIGSAIAGIGTTAGIGAAGGIGAGAITYAGISGAIATIGAAGGVIGLGATATLVAVPVVAVAVGAGAVIAGAGVVGGIGYMAHRFLRKKGTARGLEYSKVKSLYESLHDDEVQALFQTHNIELAAICQNMPSYADEFRQLYQIVIQLDDVPVPKMIEVATSHSAQVCTSYSSQVCISNSEHLHNPNSEHLHNPNSEQVKAEAAALYYKTKMEELEELNATEPDMSWENRKRIATRAATRICNLFLKDRLSYSDSEADEFIENL